MFFHLFSSAGDEGVDVISHEVAVVQALESGAPIIATGLSPYHPLEFARATNGYVYMADGLRAPFKWDGVSSETKSVGNVAPTTAPGLAFTGTGEIEGDYRAYVRFVDADGNVSNFSPPSPLVTATENSTALYSDLPTPASPKIVRRQILRNTAGQQLVFYVDLDTEDLTSTNLSSTKTDTQLRTQTAVPLFDETFTIPLANRHGLPPNDKPLIAFHQNRLWMYGEVVYELGVAQVTNGSATVTGIGTRWTKEMADRVLYLDGSSRAYTIESVSVTDQQLTLTEVYVGTNQLFAAYKIRPANVRRNLLHYSEPGLFDSWPATQAIAVASSDDIDDEPTGLVSTQSFLYIIQRRHIYRLTFLENPATDGGIFLAARRGCVNNRSWVAVDGFLYGLDDQGIYRFDGTDQTENLTEAVQDLFYFDSELGDLRVNWRASRWFHASLDRHSATIRWFVAFSGDRLPRHAICLNYSTPQWWIEEYPFACGDSTQFKAVNTAPLVAGKNRKVFAMEVGNLDLVDPAQGDTRAMVESWTRRSVTLNADAVLPREGVVGAPLAIVEGAGRGQVRRITAVNGQKISVNYPWTTALDSDQKESLKNVSVVQIGAMPWRWKSGWMEWPHAPEMQQPRKIAISFQQTEADNKVTLRVFKEFQKRPIAWESSWPRTTGDSSGIVTTDDSPDAIFDTTVEMGHTYLTIDNFDLVDEYREGVVAVELVGFSAGSEQRVFEIDVHGARG